MNDLISRSALKDALEYWTHFPKHRGGKSVYDIINEDPAVDAVEVVRCKGCKHCIRLSDRYKDDIACSKLHTDNIYPKFYCSYGERRTDHGK